MANPIKQKSGNWKVLVNYTDEYGKYRKKSFTAPTKYEASAAANEWLLERREKNNPANLTLREMCDRRIDKISNILSPSTIRGYKSIINATVDKKLLEAKGQFITSEMYQNFINKLSADHKPRTVRNVHNFLVTVFKDNNIDIYKNVLLPKNVKVEITIPTKDEVIKLFEVSEGTCLELPVKLAVCLGLRKSEIYGLTWSDIDLENKLITINKAKVLDEYNSYAEKAPKSYSSVRTVGLPDIVIESLGKPGKPSEGVITHSYKAINSHFLRVRRKYGFQFSFHALRHFNASLMLQQNIPNKYAKERMGHATEDMLNKVYQHTFNDVHQAISEKMNDELNNIFTKK